MTQDQRSTPVRSLSHVRQKEENGCIVASLAMLTGKTYDEVRADSIFSALGDEAKGASFREVEEYLFRNGFAWQEVYRCGPPGNTLKPEWPCAPWADMHICEVRTGQAHAVVLLRDGTVLDPLTDEPKRLTDYAEVYSIRAVYRIASEKGTTDDPGMVKVLTDLLDRMYKMNLMAIPALRVTEQNPDSDDPLVAWMSDVRSVLYRNKAVPDPFRDLQGKTNG